MTELDIGSRYPRGFWEGFGEFVHDRSSTTLKLNKPGQGGKWVVAGKFGIRDNHYPLGIKTIHVGAVMYPDRNELRAELFLGLPRAQRSAARYECLRAVSGEIRSAQRFPERLIWDRERPRVYWVLTTDLYDENQRLEQYRWLFERLEELRRLLAPFLRELHAQGWPPPKRTGPTAPNP